MNKPINTLAVEMAAVLTKEQQAQMRRGFGRGMMGN